MSAYGGAIVLPTGELRFRPQSFSFCGHCDNYFMMCTCSGIPHAHDYNFKSLPQPPEGSTPEMLLRRWCSCVAQSMSMSCFSALQWYADHSETKLAAMSAKQHTLGQMVEEYVARLPSDPHLPLLMKAIGLRNGAPADGAPRLAREARSAAAAFCAGDWNCVTRLGALLLNNAFQSSDSERYPLSDTQLADVFSAIDILNKVLGLGYSDIGWCLAIENDRPPHVTPPLPGASGRFRDVAQPVAQNTQCRCGSTSHKRTNHSSCPLNPKKSQRRGS
jgi:hypothetical protein